MAGCSFRGFVGLALSLGAVLTGAQDVTWVSYKGFMLTGMIDSLPMQLPLAEAQAVCINVGSMCAGVTCTNGICALRSNPQPVASPGMGGITDTAYVKVVATATSTTTTPTTPTTRTTTTLTTSTTRACPSIEGLYSVGNGMGNGPEVTIRQSGCILNGFDLNGPVFTGTLVPTTTGVTTTWSTNASYFSRGSPYYVGQLQTLNNVNTLKWSSGYNWSQIPCTRMLNGVWSINGTSPVAVVVNPVTCQAAAYTGTTNVSFKVSGQTFSVQGSGFNMVNSVFTAPDTVVSGNGATVYKLEGPIPCFSYSDYKLTAQCFTSLRAPALVSAFKAFGNRTKLSDAHNYYCFGPEQKSKQSCPPACVWDNWGGANGLGACTCLDQPSCVGNGFAWVTKVFSSCNSTFRDAITSATTDCCGATAASICSSFGTLPNAGNPVPGAVNLPAGCKFMPANTIQDFQRATSQKPRRCGAPAPQPLYTL